MKVALYISLVLVGSKQLVSSFVFNRLSSVSHRWTLLVSNDDQLNSTPPSIAARIEADKLREQVKKIRGELARLQQKTLEEVEQDAQENKKKLLTTIHGQEETQVDIDMERKKISTARMIALPETAEEQVRQASLAVERAFVDGITRQTVRLALIRENQLISSDEEEWPGGTKEMFREAGKPLSESLLSEIRAISPTLLAASNSTSSSSRYQLPPSIKTQTLWDFDGSALITAESPIGPIGDVQAMVFANTDSKYIYDIRDISKALGKDRLFILINPFWKDLDSWGYNILAPGAKRLAREIIFENDSGGYKETYVLNRGTVRGEKVAALKAYPYDWQLFAYMEDETYGYPFETAIRLGSCKDKPTTALFTQLLNSRPEFKWTKTMRQIKKSF
jgi:hypothetical protein